MTRVKDKASTREAQRLQTRQRLFGAAVAEFKRSGMHQADVGAIVAAAGVAHGTFYFHFPTKEHVLLELEHREEVWMATELARFLEKPHDLASVLREVAKLVVTVEQRLGGLLFKDVLSLHFSPTRPPHDEWTEHPVIVQLVAEIERARTLGQADQAVDPFTGGVFFLLGLYAVLATTRHATPDRDDWLAKFVTNALRGFEPR